MDLFGFLKPGKKKEDTISTLAAAAVQEEPEFLKKIDVAAAREIESEQAVGEGAGAAANVKEEVEPELALWLNNGATVKGLKELAAALKKIKAADYKEHVNEERNDIAEWVKEILNDDKLAGQLRGAKGRLQAARYVEKEILNLKTTRRKSEMAVKTAAEAMKATEPTEKAWKETARPDQKPAKARGKIKTVKTASKIKPLKPLEEETETWKEVPKETPIEEFGRGVNEELGEELMKMPEIQIPTAEEEETKRAARPKRWFWPFKKQSPEEAAQAVPEALNFPKIPEIPDKEEGITQKDAGAQELLNMEDLEELGKYQKAEAEPAELEPHYAQWAEVSEKGKESESKSKAMAEEEGEEIAELPASSAEGTKRARERKTPEEAELDRKEEELDRQEKELSSEEAKLNADKLELTRRRYELIKQKGDIERKKFELFMRKHRLTAQRQEASLTEPAEQSEHLPNFAQELKGMPDLRLGGEYGKERLQALLEEAKQHIRQNNVDEAQKALEQAQSVFNTVYMTLNEKKQMEYEILDVEADLKLASLR